MNDRGDGRPDEGLVRLLLSEWRVACARHHAPWQLASGRSALALCEAVEHTLELGTATPELGAAVRAWGSGVPSAEAARAVLQCLSEAVLELATTQFGEFRARGLDPIFEQLSKEATIPAGQRTVPAVVDPLTGCLDRQAMERDLAVAVDAATATDTDLTVAVLQAAEGATSARGWPGDDAALLGLLATLRRTFGREWCTVYRVGLRSLGIVARGADPFSVGEAILLATCLPGPAFVWGRADLRSAGSAATGAPGLLLFLAEADLHERRRDLAAATGRTSSRRHLSVVGSAAAAAVLVAGTAAALLMPPGTPTATRVAAPPPRTSINATAAPPAPAPTAEPLPSPAPSATPAPRPGSANAGAGASAVTGTVASVSPPDTDTVTPPANATLVTYQAPAPAPPASTTPPSTPTTTTPQRTPAATPPPSPTTTTPKGPPRHSGKAPGHLKPLVRKVVDRLTGLPADSGG